MKNLKPITAKQAEKLTKSLGLCWTGDSRKTYYATNEDQTEVWDFDSRADRDKACGINYN